MSLFPAMVIMGGKIVYHDGEFFTSEPRWFAGKGLIKRS
jgi:hypothetical protein